MAITHATQARTAVPAGQQPRRRALLLTASAAALVLAVAAVAWLALPRATVGATDVANELRATADLVDQHGAAMVEHGQRLAASARASTGPNQAHWIADGEHMIADGAAMRALAQRLRSSGALLGAHPTERSEVDLGQLSGEGRSLSEEGSASIAHGKAMVDHARAMAALAREPGSGISEDDVALMERDSQTIVDAGARIKRVGEMLLAFTEQARRSLGR